MQTFNSRVRKRKSYICKYRKLMHQITNMSDYDSLHGFLYELRPSVRKEVEKMEQANLEEAIHERTACVIGRQPNTSKTPWRKKESRDLAIEQGMRNHARRGNESLPQNFNGKQRAADIPIPTRLLQAWRTTLSSAPNHQLTPLLEPLLPMLLAPSSLPPSPKTATH